MSSEKNCLLRAREVTEEYLPGLDSALQKFGFLACEAEGSDVMAVFKKHSGPGLLISSSYGGSGASFKEALSIQYALGARSPSLAVGSTMHQFSIASILAMLKQGGGLEGLMLEAIARNNLLVASGFAEGAADQRIFDPHLVASTENEILLNGVKRPCSLAHSMDFLSASVSLADKDEQNLYAVLLPASSEGIEVQPFWSLPVLQATESHSVLLKDVVVPESLLFSIGHKTSLDHVQLVGFLWFELLITVSYLGVCAGLVELVNDGIQDKKNLFNELDDAMTQLEEIADASEQKVDQDLLFNALKVRYAIQDTIASVAKNAMEMLGGMAFLTDWEPASRYLTCSALMFHPPSRHVGTLAMQRAQQSNQVFTL